jgi:NADH dehydrogenase
LKQDDIDVAVNAGVRRQAAASTLPHHPSITPYVIQYGDDTSLDQLLEGANCVVHLAGILIESPSTNYQSANVDATCAVVEAAQRAQTAHFVLVSALGADARSTNGYYRSKGEAENAVTTSGLAADIIRTPMLLGPNTAGAKALVGMASRSSVKVLAGGKHILRPLDVDDLSQAIRHCCQRGPTHTMTHELVGPEPITHRDLIIATGQLLGQGVSVGSLPVWSAKFGASIMGLFRRGGVTPSVIDVITASETIHHNAGDDLDVTLTSLSITLKKLVP